MKSREERLVEVAGSISDGESVDWASEETAELGRELEGLRTLSRVAQAFGSMPQAPKESTEVLFRWGPLEILEKLGEGHFGEVYRAWDPQLQREVAVKLDRQKSALLRSRLGEAQRLAQVRHPNVLTVHGAAVHDRRAGIWTDLLAGVTLEERLASDGPLGAGELVLVGMELCRALAAVHGAGLVHGDVKTSNVVRERGGRLVLVDFGAARSVHGTMAPIPQGTPSYLAPEVSAGGDTSPASDLYALGALLYRLACGERWSPDEAPSLRDRRPDLPVDLIATIESLLAPVPADRPGSAGDAERRFIAMQGESMGAVGRWGRFRLGAVIAAILLLGVAGWWLVRETSEPSAPGLVAHLFEESSGAPLRLATGSAIRPGDRLALAVEVAEPMHVYVFNEDEEGNLFVLFPLPGMLPANPLSSGHHRLPGDLDGESQSWEVTSAGGKERFLVVGSRYRRAELERLREDYEPARRGRRVEHVAPLGSYETLRGIGGLGSSSEPTASLLARLYADLLDDPDAALWAELLVLDNPR